MTRPHPFPNRNYSLMEETYVIQIITKKLLTYRCSKCYKGNHEPRMVFTLHLKLGGEKRGKEHSVTYKNYKKFQISEYTVIVLLERSRAHLLMHYLWLLLHCNSRKE